MTRHTVQFYEQENFLYGVVADFLGDGLAGGQPAVVIATPAHGRAFAETLAAKGIDVDRLTLLDAEETLALFMSGATPDEQRFRTAMAGVLRKNMRVYGEMVDVLWRGGNGEAAIRLEELWNDVVDEHEVSLLCAYPIASFASHSDAEAFEKICRHHADVRPAEGAVNAVEVALLQQRATALNDERAFLLEAAEVLNRSLDYATRLRDLVDLVVPRLADACDVAVVREDGSCDGVATETMAEVLRSGRARVDDRQLVVPMKIGDRVIGAIRFASQSRRYTAADLQLATELARRAAIAIENSRLYYLAQESLRAKDAFLATLSHELRTPLTAILGWARMLRLGPVDEAVLHTALETIERSARSQAALIDDIFDLSKVVTGKVALEMDRVDLGAVVDSAIETVRLAAGAKRVRVDFQRPAQPTVVTGDATRLQQIAWNLLSNAIKFSRADDVVTVEVSPSCDNVHLTVRDQGAGIRPDFLPYVFEPFRQAEEATTRRYGGLGIGLAIVKSFAELHGGSVVAESAGEGAGAVFTVALPLSVSAPRLAPAAH